MLEALKSTNSASWRSDAFRLVGLSLALIAGANLLLLGAVVVPPIVAGISGGLDFSNYFLPLATQANTQAQHHTLLSYGVFVTVTLNLLIVLFVLFVAVRLINKVKSAEFSSAEQSLGSFYSSLYEQQEDIGKDFEKALSEDRWDLYAR
jgi:large-conductance mechanosensitive channel